MSRYYSVLVITVVVINGLHCSLLWAGNKECQAGATVRRHTRTHAPTHTHYY